jgi:transglutaminase-like putative cysteine protease
MKFAFFGLLFFFFVHNSSAQKSEYLVTSIADSLKENANAVVRLNQLDITIVSQRDMSMKTQRVITILNEKGLREINAYQYYDKRTIVKNIEAIIYDAAGNEIKKIKRKDFKDQSSASGGTLFSDNRYLYLEYTPISYPFTVIFNCETQTSTTAFIQSWYPLSGYFLSIEKSILNVTYPNKLGFRKKEAQFSTFNVKKTSDTDTKLSYVATNILAQKPEDYSPVFKYLYPKVVMSLEYFNLEGIDGNAKDWKEYGKWFSDKILTGTTTLSEETKGKIKTLVGNETDPLKKAKIIYKYVQEKSRYVSIQVGIGGWKPMLAEDVDRLGYGDCKALSNYTRALLDVVGVPSYYTELYGDSDLIDVDEDFFSIQGNHVILCIPDQDKYVFLECTSQDDPFGYQANFTDNRKVIVIKPDGGEIIKTTIYEPLKNTQDSKGIYNVDENGGFSGKINIVSEGSLYGTRALVEKLQPTEKDAHYKNYWSNINNLKLGKLALINDKDNIRFTEDVQISATEYATISANKMIFTVDAFNQSSANVKRIRNRKNPFQIQRGYLDTDEMEINLPTGFAIEFLPSNFELKGKFGEYKTEIIKKENNKLIYKRSMFLNKGKYSSKEYDEYRLFMEQVSRNDNAKIILIKN